MKREKVKTNLEKCVNYLYYGLIYGEEIFLNVSLEELVQIIIDSEDFQGLNYFEKSEKIEQRISYLIDNLKTLTKNLKKKHIV